MGFLSNILGKNINDLELRAKKMEDIAKQLEYGLEPSLFTKIGKIEFKEFNKKENCRNCGANSYKENKCEYCGTKI